MATAVLTFEPQRGDLAQPRTTAWVKRPNPFQTASPEGARQVNQHAAIAGGAYMPPFGMYAIMPPRIAAPRAPVHSGPIAKRSHPSQNDVWSARISLADLVS